MEVEQENVTKNRECFVLNQHTPDKCHPSPSQCNENIDPNIPSPFKKALFWPETKTENMGKRKKERFQV